MKKIIMILLPLFLMGCGKDIQVSDMVDRVAIFEIPKDKEPTNGLTVVEDNYPCLALLANQVLGTTLSKDFKTKTIQLTNQKYSFSFDEKPLSKDLADSKLTKQLVQVMVAVVNGQKAEKMNINGNDFKKFVEASLGDIESLYADSDTKQKANKMFGPERALTRQGMLLVYLKAYIDGKFVDRSGNIISKPAISGTGVSDATVAGLLDVFLEAFYDYALSGKSPILMQKDKVVTYVPMYLADPQNTAVFIQKFRQVKTNDWFTDKNNQPTAADFVPIEEVTDTGTITPSKARMIKFVANLSGEKAKALTGIIFRTFGSVDAGFMIFGKFNIGDNQIVASLLDTTFEVSSRRMMELAAYQFFSKKVDQLLFKDLGDPWLHNFDE